MEDVGAGGWRNVEEVESIEDTDMHMEKSLERITKERLHCVNLL